MGIGYISSDLPGKWRQDPISLIPMLWRALGKCIPFVLNRPASFALRLFPPSPARSTRGYNEVKRLAATV